MELKTKLNAIPGTQNIDITREFDLPLDLLFLAYEDSSLIEQWMGTNVLRNENHANGCWAFETRDAGGNPVFKAHGTYHAFTKNSEIVRTFEIENAPFGAQLEFLEFEDIGESRSRLHMQIVYKSGAIRDQMLQLPFAKGLSMAHDRLQEMGNKIK